MQVLSFINVKYIHDLLYMSVKYRDINSRERGVQITEQTRKHSQNIQGKMTQK